MSYPSAPKASPTPMRSRRFSWLPTSRESFQEIFKAPGFRVEVLGMKKIHASQNWWSVSYNKDTLLGLQDWRKDRPEAIEDAKINAEVNKVENVECILGKSEEVIDPSRK